MKQETTFYTFSDAVAAQKDKRAFKLVYGVQTLTSTMSFLTTCVVTQNKICLLKVIACQQKKKI